MSTRTGNPGPSTTLKFALLALCAIACSVPAAQASAEGVEAAVAKTCSADAGKDDAGTVSVIPELVGLNGAEFVCIDRKTAQSFAVESVAVVEHEQMQAAFVRVKLQPESDVRWQKFRDEHAGHGLVLMRNSFAIIKLQIPQGIKDARFEIYASTLAEADQLKAALLGK